MFYSQAGDHLENSTICQICLDPWKSSGDHVGASLKCGHLFGLKCIENWFSLNKAKLCPICKASNTKNDIRRHYISPPKPKAADNVMVSQLRQMEEELARARRELITSQQSLKAAQDALHQSLNDETEKSHSKAILRQEQQKTAQGGMFQFLRRKYDLNCGGSVAYLEKFDACIASCSHSAAASSPIQTLTPRLQGKIQVDPESPIHGVLVISQWWKGDSDVLYLPLHDRPITSISPSPHDRDIFATSSLDGSIKVVKLFHDDGRVAADVLVDIKIDGSSSPVWCCKWDEYDRNVVYLAWQNRVLAFDLRESSQTQFNVLVALNPQQAMRRFDKIFSIVQLAAPAGTTTRLVVGSTWGILDLVLLNGKIITLDSLCERPRPEAQEELSAADAHSEAHWNLLCPHNSTREVLLVGYTAQLSQIYIRLDLRSKLSNNNLLAFRAPLAVPLPRTVAGASVSTSGFFISYNGDDFVFVHDSASKFPVALRWRTPAASSSASSPPPLPPPVNSTPVLSEETLAQFPTASSGWALLGNSNKFAIAVVSSSSLRFLAAQRPSEVPPL